MTRQREVILAVRSLGDRLGFISRDEEWIGAHIVAGGYRPRLDATWCLDLKAAGFNTDDISTLTSNSNASLYGVIGAEVEVARPTTKRHFSNLANLTLAQLPYSVLVVDVSGEADMYRRANRAIRAFNYRYGSRDAIAIDIGQLERACRRVASRELLLAPEPRVIGAGGLGGESNRTRVLRRLLTDRGLRVGFVVLHDAPDERMATEFSRLARAAPGALEVPWDPGRVKKAVRASQFWTASRPDVSWAIEPGRGLKDLIESISAEVGTTWPYSRFGPVPDLITVMSFELERSGGKHAAGAAFTLAAQPGVGVVVASRLDEVNRMLESHGRVIGAGQIITVAEDALIEMFS